MRPFIEIDGAVFVVVGWEPEMVERERYEIRRLSEEEANRYCKSRNEMDIELHQNFVSGTRPPRS